MNGRGIYQRLCEAANLDAAVARLTSGQLATVAQYLAELRPAGGVPSQVWGVVSAALNPTPGRKAKSHL